MPTTEYTDHGARVMALQGRTDAAGHDVVDYSAADARTIAELFTQGAVNLHSYQPQVGTGLKISVGSGTPGLDLAILEGQTPGQGNYVVAIDSGTVDIPIGAADLTAARIDTIWLAVEDDAYDSSGRSLARIAVRKGDPSSTPAEPGPDGSWTAKWHIATVHIAAGATALDPSDLHDERTQAAALVAPAGFITRSLFDAHTANFSNPHHVTAAQVGLRTNTQNDGRFAPKSHSHAYLTTATADGRYYTKTQGNSRYAAKSHTHSYLTQSTADGRYATRTHDHDRLYVSGVHGARKVTISTHTPSGGSDGDIWMQYV